MLYYVMLCYIMLYYVMLYYVLLCYVMLYYVMLCYVILYIYIEINEMLAVVCTLHKNLVNYIKLNYMKPDSIVLR